MENDGLNWGVLNRREILNSMNRRVAESVNDARESFANEMYEEAEMHLKAAIDGIREIAEFKKGGAK